MPDGWKLYTVVDGSAKGSALIGNVDGLIYKANMAPLILRIGGGDGATAFSVFFNTSSVKPDAAYIPEGPVQGANVQGTKYSYTQKVEPGEGAGTVPKGTRVAVYYFEHTSKSIGVVYNIFSGDPDYSALIKSLVGTLKFN